MHRQLLLQRFQNASHAEQARIQQQLMAQRQHRQDVMQQQHGMAPAAGPQYQGKASAYRQPDMAGYGAEVRASMQHVL